MTWPQRWGVLDEAGDVGSAGGSSRCLVVAVVLTENLQPLRRVVTRARKRLGKRLKDIPELKAWHTPPGVVLRLVEDIAGLDIEVIAVALIKDKLRVYDVPEDRYRRTCALAVRRCLEMYPYLSLILDRRYTKQQQEDLLIETLLENTAELSGNLICRYEASEREKAIQAADAVAWALYQKYEHGDEMFYRVIRGKITKEEVMME